MGRTGENNTVLLSVVLYHWSKKTHIRRYQWGNQNPYIDEVSLESLGIFVLYENFLGI
jgi:hypothetical protein